MRRKPMKNRKSILFVAGLVLVFIVAATAADRPPLTFTFTKANVPGAILTTPGGVNNLGMTVGQYEDKGKVFHGYILNGTRLTTVDDPNGTSSSVGNIQYNGTTVVGSYLNSAGASVGFLYKRKKFTDIPGPTGATAASANAINDKGAIVGNYTDASKVTHGFLLKGTTYTTLDIPGAAATVATGINNKGTIVLYGYLSSGALESDLTTNNGKTYKSINVPGSGKMGSACLDINNENDVAFQWFDSKTVPLFHGALLHNGKYYKFNYPKAVQTYGGGLNDKSTITGGYQAKSKGPFSGYKATFK
jgi:probable HAF family extracellular repeat protein